jgi:hypothetical protein
VTRFALAVFLMAACTQDALTPEEEIATMVETFKQAASDRDVAAAADLISESYSDPGGRDKRALKALVARYFLGHEAIHVFSRVRTLELGEPPASARVVVAAALTGAPVADVGELETLSADLYRFELDLVREDEGRWRITRARWRPAQIADFF